MLGVVGSVGEAVVIQLIQVGHIESTIGITIPGVMSSLNHGIIGRVSVLVVPL